MQLTSLLVQKTWEDGDPQPLGGTGLSVSFRGIVANAAEPSEVRRAPAAARQGLEPRREPVLLGLL